MTKKINDPTAILQPVQLKKPRALFILNQKHMLQQMALKKETSFNTLHARNLLKWH